VAALVGRLAKVRELFSYYIFSPSIDEFRHFLLVLIPVVLVVQYGQCVDGQASFAKPYTSVGPLVARRLVLE